MGNELALNHDFKEKLFEKIRTDIGSLLTEEQMRVLVESAFERTFFQERRTVRQYGSDEILPPLIVELVEKALSDKVDVVIRELVESRADEIQAMVERHIEDGASKMFLMAIDKTFSNSMEVFKLQIMSDLISRT